MSTDFFTAADFVYGMDRHQDERAVEAARRANALLKERGAVVYGRERQPGIWTLDTQPHESNTHAAIMLQPQPIKCDTAEDLLRELTAHCNYPQTIETNAIFLEKLAIRARKLLEGRGT